MPRPMVRPLRTVLRRLRGDEQGSFLIEVMATCLLLAMVGGGTLALLDRAQQQSGVQRARAVAADLAQGRLDELRGLPYEQLRDMTPAEAVPREVDGVLYTLTPTVTQLTSTDTPGACATDRGRDLLQVSVAVTALQLARVKPVRLDTYVAAPVGASGSVRVVVNDSRGVPVDGVTVSAGGRTAITAAGCAQLFLTPGTHTLTVSRSGFTTPAGEETVTQQITVNAEQTSSVSVELDRPGTARLRFRYRPIWDDQDEDDEADFLVAYDSDPKVVQFLHSGLNVPRKYTITSFPASSPWETTFSGLYPFPSAYSTWAGGCDAAKPPRLASVIVPQGATSATVTVDLYALNVRVRRGTTTADPDTVFRIRNLGCDSATVWDRSSIANTAIPGRRIIARNGFPYGTGYQVCAYSRTAGRYAVASNVSTYTGAWPGAAPTPTQIDLSTGTAGTGCPW